jgi:hypothetical protein
MERSGDKWDTGAVDICGALMVLVLKQVALGHNRADNFAREASKQCSAERHGLYVDATPNILHYFSYMFASGNLLAGPFFEYRDYMNFTNRRGEWRRACDGRFFGMAMISALQCLGLAFASLSIGQTISHNFSAHMLVEPDVLHRSMVQRYALAFLVGKFLSCSFLMCG